VQNRTSFVNIVKVWIPTIDTCTESGQKPGSLSVRRQLSAGSARGSQHGDNIREGKHMMADPGESTEKVLTETDSANPGPETGAVVGSS